MIPIIDRYIFWEVTKAFLAMVIMLLLVLVGGGYMRFLGEAAVGNIGHEVMLTLISIEALRVMAPITPPAFFLAILVTLGRMYRDSEITALSASGIGTARLYRAVILAAVPVILLVSWLTLDLQPWANGAKMDIFSEQGATAEISAAVAGRFNEFSHGDLVFYVEGMSRDRNRLENVFVQNRQHGRLGLITAKEGHRYVDQETGEQFVVLTEGRRYEGKPGHNDFTIAEFEKYALRMDFTQKKDKRRRNDALPTSQLLDSTDIEHRVELQYRLMLPAAVLVFTIISVPLSYSLPRGGMYGRMILAILFYFTFVNMLAVSGGWMESGITPPWMGRWWVHLLMLSLAGLLVISRSPRLARTINRLMGGEKR